MILASDARHDPKVWGNRNFPIRWGEWIMDIRQSQTGGGMVQGRLWSLSPEGATKRRDVGFHENFACAYYTVGIVRNGRCSRQCRACRNKSRYWGLGKPEPASSQKGGAKNSYSLIVQRLALGKCSGGECGNLSKPTDHGFSERGGAEIAIASLFPHGLKKRNRSYF